MIIIFDLLDLVKFTDNWWVHELALHFWVDDKAHEEQRIVETTSIFEHSHNRVDVTRVDIDLLVYLEHLEKVEASARSSIRVSNQVCLAAQLVKEIIFFAVEKP